MGNMIVVRPGQVCPDDILASNLEKFPGYITFALVDENGDLLTQTATGVPIDVVRDNLETFRDNTVYVYFGDAPMNEEDQQPYELLRFGGETDGDEGSPGLVVFAIGDFSPYNQQESAFSDAYNMVEEEIKPLINTLVTATEGDMDKLLAALRADGTKKKLEKLWLGRGVISFLAQTGDNITCELNPLRREYVWGITTDSLEPAATPVSQSPARKTLSLSSAPRPNVAGTGPQPQLTAPTAGKPAPRPPQVVGKLGDPPVKDAATAVEYWKPPTNLHGKPRKAMIREKYREYFGRNELPKNWDDGSFKMEIPVTHPDHSQYKAPAGTKVKALNELPKVVGNTNLLKTTTEARTPNLAPSRPVTPQPASVEDDNPIVDQQVWDAFNDDILPRFEGRVIVRDPALAQSWEKKYPTFSDKADVAGLEETFTWDWADFRDTGDKYPRVLAILAMEYRTNYFKALNDIDELLKKPSTTTAVSPAAPRASARPVLTVPGCKVS